MSVIDDPSPTTSRDAQIPAGRKRRRVLKVLSVVVVTCVAFAGGAIFHEPVLRWAAPEYPVPATMFDGRAPSDTYDFVVQIEHHGINCVGTLVAHDWALTAGHCNLILNVGETTVVAGTPTPGRGGETALVDGVVIHPRYLVNYPPGYSANDSTRVGYDLALVHLNRPMPYPTVALGTDVPPVGSELRGVAFHMDCKGSSTERRCYNPDQQELDLRTVTSTQCSPIAPALEQCLQNEQRKGLCRGSSGTPLLQQTPSGAVLTALVSRDGDKDVACLGGSFVVTSIAPQLAWIRKVTGPGLGPEGLPAPAGPLR